MNQNIVFEKKVKFSKLFDIQIGLWEQNEMKERTGHY